MQTDYSQSAGLATGTELATAPAEGRLRLARLLGLLGLAVFVATWYGGLAGADARLLALPLLAGLGLAPAAAWATERGRLLDGLGRVSPARYYGALSVAAGGAWAAAYVLMVRHLALSTFDAGIYSNVAANTARGWWLHSSFLGGNHLGEHFSPVMALFAPLYALCPGLGWLLGAQLAAYLAVPPLLQACLGARDARQRGTGYLVAILWYLYAPMAAAMFFPFHPSSLGGPVLVLAFLMLQRRRWGLMVLLLLLSLGFKENYALAVMGFGLFLFFRERQRLLGAALVAAGGLAGYLLIAQVIPAFRGAAWSGHLMRLGPLQDLPDKGFYLLILLAPLGFLPLWQWRSGLLALPAVLLNLATRFGMQYSGDYHYDDLAAVLLFLALVDILRRPEARRFLAHWPRAGALAGAAWVGAVVFLAADSPLRYVRKYAAETLPYGQIHAQLRRLDAVDATRKVLVQSHLGPALSRANVAVLLTENAPLDPRRLAAGDLVVLLPGIDPWGVGDVAQLSQALRESPELAPRPDFAPLEVFEKK